MDCSKTLLWTRPETLEELIPEDVRKRWGIVTHTKIRWPEASTAVAESEISDLNCISLLKKDGVIRKFMKAHKLHTTHKMDDNINNLREWAVQNGKKIRWID
jgi:hypothetical protein